MIQVRPVRGGLDEAMAQVKDFESLSDYADHIYLLSEKTPSL